MKGVAGERFLSKTAGHGCVARYFGQTPTQDSQQFRNNCYFTFYLLKPKLIDVVLAKNDRLSQNDLASLNVDFSCATSIET